MLLFVARDVRRLPLRAARGASDRAAHGLLWVAIVFTALLGLGRAFVPEREQRVLDALVLAPCDRSAIWLGEVARDARLPRRGRARRAAGLRALLPRPRLARPSPRSRSRTSGSARSGRSRRRWQSRRARASCCCRSSSCRSRSRSSSAASARASADAGPLPRLPRALRPALRAHSAGRSSSTSSPSDGVQSSAIAASVCRLPRRRWRSSPSALALVFFVAPNDADQGFSQRIFYFHVPIAFTAYRCFGWGAWKALRHLWKREPSARPRELRRDPPGRHLRRARCCSQARSGRRSRGGTGGSGARTSSCSSSSSSSSTARTSCCASRSRPGRSARTSAPSTRSSASCSCR